MPAPNATRLAALRAGTAGRHVFFKLAHSQGNVLAWDGIGKFTFLGDTYEGVAGFASMTGVSNSGDLQNHDIEVRLNGVPRTSMSDIDPRVRGCTATIYAVWIGEGGTIYDSKLIFSGSGNNLKAIPGESDLVLACRLRAAVADWAFIPRIYYSDVDQQRLYPGDTGCNQVALLENAVIAGWKDGPTDPIVYWYYDNPLATATPKTDFIADANDNVPLGHHTWGLSTFVVSNLLKTSNEDYKYQDAVTATDVAVGSLGAPLTIGGVSCTVDSSGDVRTPGGNLVCSSNSLTSANRLRRPGTIASTGTATATEVESFVYGSVRIVRKVGGTFANNDVTGLVFQNSGPGLPKDATESVGGGITFKNVIRNIFSNNKYTEDGFTTRELGSDGSRKLIMQKSDGTSFGKVYVSTTGCLIGPGGGKIYEVGYPERFLRLWT